MSVLGAIPSAGRATTPNCRNCSNSLRGSMSRGIRAAYFCLRFIYLLHWAQLFPVTFSHHA